MQSVACTINCGACGVGASFFFLAAMTSLSARSSNTCQRLMTVSDVQVLMGDPAITSGQSWILTLPDVFLIGMDGLHLLAG